MQMLKDILAQNPADAFARYGLAMEYSKAGDIETALTEFNALLEQWRAQGDMAGLEIDRVT
jgi:thioredoxin-like negative regulator of GroEL